MLSDFELGAITTGAGTAIGAIITWLVARWYSAKDFGTRRGEAAATLALEFSALNDLVQKLPDSAAKVTDPRSQLQALDHVLSPDVRVRCALRLPKQLRGRVGELAGKHVLLTKAVATARGFADGILEWPGVPEERSRIWSASDAASAEFVATYGAVLALRTEVLRDSASVSQELWALAVKLDE